MSLKSAIRNSPSAIADCASRRQFLYGLGSLLGQVALSALVRADDAGASRTPPLAPRVGHVPARAKNCILLFMEGGPSHIDTFDPKPALEKLHMSEFVKEGKLISDMGGGKRYYVKSPFAFRQVGDAGMSMCEHWHHLSQVADDLCVYRGLTAESVDHPSACYHMNTGNRFAGDPGVGSWVTYGLGTLNQNLPAFVVLPVSVYPQGGTANWSNGYLPANFQGTPLRSKGSPIADLRPPAGVTPELQRHNLDLLRTLEQDFRHDHPAQADDLAARMEAYELAFRMQTEVPNLIDLDREPESVQEMYGLGDKKTDQFGRKCLLARKLVEEGVRFVQIFDTGWDSHDDLNDHVGRLKGVDKPIAGLIQDLKQRGMLDETLVVWCGEFGRSPDNGMRAGSTKIGRDHNADAMTVFLAGGGCKAGHVVGATDELGARAVEVVHPIKDFHVTLLRLLGLDDNKLTYLHAGRFKQLSQTGGTVISELLG